MAAITVEKDVYEGTTPKLSFTIFDNGVAYNLTGATVTFGLKATLSDAAYIVNRACTLDADPTTGKCSITLTAIETGTEGAYVAEIKVVSGVLVIIPVQFTLNINDSVLG